MIPNQDGARQQESATAPTQPRGAVASIQICREHRAPMEKLTMVRVLQNMGLEGDRHAVPDGSRQVLLIEQETLDRLAVPAGAVKENITTRGIDLMKLPPRTRLQIGEALFELTKPCDPCSRMDDIRLGLQDELEGQRGMLARVLRGGEIRGGDKVKIVG